MRTNGAFTPTYTYRAGDGKPTGVATSVNVAGVLTANYTRTLGYDAQARPSTVDHNGAATYAYGYGARGHRTAIRHGSTVLQAFEGTDAFGSSTAESFNGGAFGTARTFDAATGRLLTVETGPSATPKGIQDLEYKWREDGSLYRRIDRRGTAAIADDRTDTFTLDGQRRLERQATTGGAARTLDFGYDGHGNLTTKTSSVAGDLDATAYAYGTAGKPHRLTRVTLDGVVNTLTYDANGNIAGYDAATGDDTAIAYDGQNRVESITVGTAKDEFWHGPDGGRFLRRETWTEDGAAKSKLTVYLGAYEEVRRSDATVKRVRASGSVVRVRVEPAAGTPTERFEYVHRDHLGSVDRVTDGTGAPASTLSASSFDPFGGRRAADWSGDEPPATAANVLALQDERFSRGFTDHEGLHRTGFVHMNGRVYDPRIGRFLQPDPVVSAPGTGQGHNRYAYVANAPLSATDPSGFMPVGGYVGRTGGTADYGPLYGSLMNDLWSAGFKTVNLSTFDAVITKGMMNPAEFDYYLRTGVDLRRLAQTMGGEWIFPEGDDRSRSRDAFNRIIVNGILETREAFQERVNSRNALGYYDPSDGFLGDVLQALFQKLVPSTDWMGRRLAEYLATRKDSVTVEGYSGGTLTVTNALRRVGHSNRFAVTLHSPVVSYPTARFVIPGVNYNQPWGDISNLLAPSLNPVKFASGLLDLFCGACIHRGNNF